MVIFPNAMKDGRVGTIRIWSAVHKWTSLVSTAFLLLLCITGLPLIFHEDIDDYLNPPPVMSEAPAGTSAPTLDPIVAKALASNPGDVMISLGFAQDRPVVVTQSAPSPATPFNLSHRQAFDLRTGNIADQRPQSRGALTTFLRDLHTELFLGLPGSLFLGVMALCMVAAVIREP